MRKPLSLVFQGRTRFRAGTVAEGPADLIGLRILGSGRDIGFTRDGSHAEFTKITAAPTSRRPESSSAEENKE